MNEYFTPEVEETEVLTIPEVPGEVGMVVTQAHKKTKQSQLDRRAEANQEDN